MIRKLIVYAMTVSVLLAGVYSATTVAAPAATTEKCPGDSILLFPTWYQGLNCKVTKDSSGAVSSQYVQLGSVTDIWIVVMNIVQWLIIAGGYVSLYFIIWAGFKYMIAAGDPQKITQAKGTITNAVIGLIIVLASVAIVRTIQAGIGGTIS